MTSAAACGGEEVVREVVRTVEVVKEVQVPIKVEEVNITVRTTANPPTEDWRGNNFLAAVADVNLALLAGGDNRQIKLNLIQDNKDWGEYKREFALSTDAGNPPEIMLSGHEDIGDSDHRHHHRRGQHPSRRGQRSSGFPQVPGQLRALCRSQVPF